MDIKKDLNHLVSVIMPTYNPNLKLLMSAIQSVLFQTYSNIELIICDDGSNPPVKSYLNKLALKLFNPNNIDILIVRNNINMGISVARNKAIANSNGKWLTWLDSDDSLKSDCVEKLVSESSRYHLVVGECNVYENGAVYRRKPKMYFDLAKKNFKTENDPFLLNIISLQPQLILKKDFHNIGGFNECYKCAELTELFLKYISLKGLGKVTFIEEAIYNYNRNTINSITKDRKNLFKYRLKALYYYKQFIPNSVGELRYQERDKNTGMQKYFLIK